MDLSLETRAGGEHKASAVTGDFGSRGLLQQPSPSGALAGNPGLTPSWWPLGDPLGTAGLVLALQTVHLPVTDLLQPHQLQGLFADEVVIVQVELDCRERGRLGLSRCCWTGSGLALGGSAEPAPAQPGLQSWVCRAVAVPSSSGKRGERRAGAVPRNPTITRQARVSTAARTGMPIRLKDCSVVEVLRLLLGPATQRSVALRRPGQRGSIRAPSSRGHYLCHSAARRLNPANQRGRSVTRLKVQPKGAWRGEGSVAAGLAGESRSQHTASVIPSWGGQPGEAEEEPCPGQRGGCRLFGFSRLTRTIGREAAPAAVELLGMEVAVGERHVLV